MIRFSGAVLLVWIGAITPALAQPLKTPDATRSIPGANAGAGREIILNKGCNACHVISGIPGPFGRVGPTLDGLSTRAYIAGSLPNTPGSLVSWLMDPPRHAPRTAMPNLGLTSTEAMDVAAFLYTLR